MIVGGEGDHGLTAASLEALRSVTMHSDKSIRGNAVEGFELTCGASKLSIKPEEITLSHGAVAVKIRREDISIEAPTIWLTGQQYVDLQAGRINLNSREGSGGT
jgi:hypothetical protein